MSTRARRPVELGHEHCDPNPVWPVHCRLINERGGTYFVKIDLDRDEAAAFLREMWQFVDESIYPQEQALSEWTDRCRDIRSTWSDYAGVCVRTHAWSPEGDTMTLHESVLEFMRNKGLTV